jgi:TM2 domain-containing membrane protein YozV
MRFNVMKKIVGVIVFFIIVIGVGAGIFYLGKFVRNIFTQLDKEIAAALLTTSTTIIVAVATVVIGKQLEKKREIEHQHRIQKTEIYEKFMLEWFKILSAKGNYPQDKLIRFIEEFSRKIILWGGRKVINKYSMFRKFGLKTAGKQDTVILLYFEQVLFEIRKDLGHSNKNIAKGELISLFISDPQVIDKKIKKYQKNKQ